MTSKEEYAMWVETFERSPLHSLFPSLRKGLYHTTSVQGYQGIRKDDHILPNDGRFPYTYPQSANSYATHRGYISLFDFEVPTENQIIEQIWKWESFFLTHHPYTVVLGFDRTDLASKLVTYDIAHQEVGFKKVKIPYIEVWYTEPISLSLLKRVFLIPKSEPSNYSVFEANDKTLAKLDKDFALE